MLLLRESVVRSVLTMSDAVACVEQATVRQTSGLTRMRPRDRLRIPSGTLNVLPAADLELGVAGLKTYIALAGGARFAILLFDLVSGDLLSVLEADYLGMMRTGAASGVATRHMAAAGSDHTLSVIGAGWQARGQVEGVQSVCSVGEVRVFSPTPPRREAFAAWVEKEHDVRCIPVGSAREACAGAGVICTITNSSMPVIEVGDVEPGTHINAAGSNSLVRRELADELVDAADAIVVDSRDQAEREAGDLLAGLQNGRIELAQLPELSEIVAGVRPGRTDNRQITIFESQGLGLHDVVVAHHVYTRARDAGLGQEISFAEPLSKAFA